MEIKKDVAGYTTSPKDFVYLQEDGGSSAVELTVTITLSEYRGLIEAKARADMSGEVVENWKLRAEIERLKAAIAEYAVAESEEVQGRA